MKAVNTKPVSIESLVDTVALFLKKLEAEQIHKAALKSYLVSCDSLMIDVLFEVAFRRQNFKALVALANVESEIIQEKSATQVELDSCK